MKILGLNAFHGDSAAALLIDGQLIAAVEEERFTRIKHWSGFPAQSINYCLREAGLDLSDIDHVAIATDPRKNFLRKMSFAIRHPYNLSAILSRLQRGKKTLSLPAWFTQTFSIPQAQLHMQFHQIEHHRAHAASTFYGSGWDSAAVMTIDGMGDFSSTTTSLGNSGLIHPLSEINYPHSLGFLYTATTMYLGFLNYGDEYKVMGLAPYGKPRYLDLFRKMIRKVHDGFRLDLSYFTHVRNGIKMNWENGDPKIEPFFSNRFIDSFGPQPKSREDLTSHHEDIAASLQAITEEIIFHLATTLYRRTKASKLCFAGGCAMNSVANGKLRSNTPFDQVYIPPGAADNGTSFGAALALDQQLTGRKIYPRIATGLLGPQPQEQEIVSALTEASGAIQWEKLEDEEIYIKVVDSIISGQIIGWFRGRMEFGARALGARSLVADPRRTDIRDIINLKIKMREKFRPFAPSILSEHVAEWFENPCDVPFMEQVLPFKPEKRHLVPAVCHVDGTGRLQSVHRDTNPDYWNLISTFHQRTGVPMVLNTSLNENEPIVCSAAQALSCFLRTRMDAIVLGEYFVRRV